MRSEAERDWEKLCCFSEKGSQGLPSSSHEILGATLRLWPSAEGLPSMCKALVPILNTGKKEFWEGQG
jgi:hypothetical protein